MKRRELLETALSAAAAGVLVECDGCVSTRASSPEASQAVARRPPVTPAVEPDIEIALRAAPGTVQLLEGPRTEVWRFSASLLRGAEGAVQNGAGYLGPTFRLKRGQRVRVRLDNALGEPTIVHWHGLHVAEKADGHPSYAVASGRQYVYDFEVNNRAGTYWYHPHPDKRTAPQVYAGLAGLLLVTDDNEKRLGLPDGDREFALVLQDRTFDEENRLVYSPNRMLGFLGDQVLVNGQVAHTKELPRGPHRLRILNGSNSRIYDLAWSDGSPLTVLGTDGGLLETPRQRAHVVLAPAQRLDIWADFGNGPGDDVWLESRAFDDPGPTVGMGMGMGMGGGAPARVANGAPLRLQHFVARGGNAASRPPDQLSAAGEQADAPPLKAGAPKTFNVQMSRMRWLLNGRSFEMSGVARNERARLGTTEDWEFVNASGGMAMAHPIHLHGPQFRVVERRSGPGTATLREGIFDEGWLDTFLLLPGDRVRLRMRFERYPGLFLYHCHNLEHEDMGMMRNYLVEG